MPSTIGQIVGGADAGVTVGANYLRVVQSPGAALAGVTNNGAAPLLTFSTPNLQLFKVVVTGEDLVTGAHLADSSWSKVIRALQVTSELFAVFAPATAGGDSTFCFMAPDFNTNTGASDDFSILETAIVAAVGGGATVTRAALTGASVA